MQTEPWLVWDGLSGLHLPARQPTSKVQSESAFSATCPKARWGLIGSLPDPKMATHLPVPSCPWTAPARLQDGGSLVENTLPAA